MMCGLIGAPWMSAATVRSVAHVSSLTVMSRTHAPGQKPHIIEVKGLWKSFVYLHQNVPVYIN